MNKTTKGISFAVAMFAIAGLMVAFNNQEAYARPDPDIGFDVEHVMKINLKGVPTAGDAKCSGNSNNIYMHVPTRGHQHVDVVRNTDGINKVTDNCMKNIDNSRAEVTLDEDGETFFLTIRLLGSPASELKFCSQVFSDHENELTDHCILDVVVAHNGKPVFDFKGTVFSDAFEDEVWNFEGNGKFRIAQLDIWVATA